MKRFQRFLTGAAIVSLAMVVGVSKSNAQIWAFYDMQIVNQFFNPLVGQTNTLFDFDFKNAAGFIDRDDGVANNVPVGFNFNYNGSNFSTVNVCVNGWASVGPQPTPVITNDIYYLFRANQPNNTLAPFWGDHFYRSQADIDSIGQHFKPTLIQYSTIAVPNTCDPDAPPGALVRTFTLEWKDLNINDKKNVNSIATFQIKILENCFSSNPNFPDNRATIEFHYGSIGNLGTVKTQGSTVGIEDSVTDSLAHSWMNGLFPSSYANEDSTRLNKDSLTSCWPPATCLPGRVIQFTPEGKGRILEWGDGDVNLTQLDNTQPAEIRLNQNRFVTLADADSLLRAVAKAYPPLDSVEGRQAFHGDANHNGKYQNPLFPGYDFYRVTAYDAAYILMYLAAKLPFLPWPQPLPLPVYKESGSDANSISGIYADTKHSVVRGSTTLVPVTFRGSVNGPVAFDLNVKSLDAKSLQFTGVESSRGMMQFNAELGKVVFAAAGQFVDGDVLGYIQLHADANAEFEMTNVMVNDQPFAGQHGVITAQTQSVDATGANALEQNSPNPFNIQANALTTIGYSVANPTVATIKIFDVLGNEVRALENGTSVTAGNHTLYWDGRDASGALVPSGVYYYQLTTPEFTKAVKMQVTR
jgi:hypothetical protein